MKRIGVALPALLVVACSRPSLAGNWTIQDPALAKLGINSTIEYTEKEYTMTTVMATSAGEDIRVTTSGTYSLDGNKLTTTATDAKVDDSKLSPQTKAQFAPQLDRAAILKNAQSNPTMDFRFLGADKAELTDKSGRKITMARTNIKL